MISLQRFVTVPLVLPLLLLLSAGPSMAAPSAKDDGITGRAQSKDGVEIAYSSHGKGSTALVFLHGWACDQSFWEPQVEALSERYQVVTLDLAGHGDSGTERETWNIENFAPDVAAVIEALGLKQVFLIGHSMGGPVALETARLIPEKVIGVIGADTFHNAEFEIPAESWQNLVDAYRRDFAETCKQMVAGSFLPTSDEVLKKRVHASMCGGDPEVIVPILATFGSYRSAPAMADVEAPIRAINAKGAFATQVEINRKYAKDFDAVLMPDVGHFLMLEQPETFNRHLEAWITELLGR